MRTFLLLWLAFACIAYGVGAIIAVYVDSTQRLFYTRLILGSAILAFGVLVLRWI